MDGSVLLEVKDLEVSFYTKEGEVQAIRKINYQLKPGEVLGIVGESGSGKSVSSLCILKLMPEIGKIKNGQILFEGKDIITMSKKEIMELRGNDISMIFQEPMTSLDPLFTIGYQIDEALKKHTVLDKVQREKRIIELLEMVGINQPEKRMKQYPHEFSGGMRQRAMIAMALCCSPKVLIADEPTTALDVTTQAQIVDLLKELKERLNMAIIFITHDLGVVSDICDKIIVMYAGQIIESGYKRQIFYKNRHPYTQGLLNSVPKIDLESKEELVPIEGNPPDMLRIRTGCPFAPRCGSRMKICVREEPPQVSPEEGHGVSCWLMFKDGQQNTEGEERKGAL